MEASFGSSNIWVKTFLAFGILSAVINIGADLVGGYLKPGYRFDSQSASILSAYGTSTRNFVLPLTIITNLLQILFSIGVWAYGEKIWIFRVMAMLLAGNAIFTMIAVSFFPTHIDEPMNSTANKLNVIFMFTAVFLFFLAICFGIFSNPNWFRYFSIGLVSILFAGVIFGLLIAKSKTEIFGQHGPLVGFQERTMIYSWQLWLALQAIILLR